MRRYLDTVHYDFERDELRLETLEGGVSEYTSIQGEQRAQILQELIWNWESLRLDRAPADH